MLSWSLSASSSGFRTTTIHASARANLRTSVSMPNWEALRKKLKANKPCSRVQNVKTTTDSLIIDIQRAFYFDQVATNLSLDFVHNNHDSKNTIEGTIRDWDIKQSETKEGNVPSFLDSKLANTISVALAIIATDKHGEKIILTGERTDKVAVYANMIHLPLRLHWLLIQILAAAKQRGTELGKFGRYVLSKRNHLKAERFACKMRSVVKRLKKEGICTMRGIRERTWTLLGY